MPCYDPRNSEAKLDFEGFVAKLNELSKEYGIWISGCGCCGSPNAGKLWGDEIEEYKYDTTPNGQYIDNLKPKERKRSSERD